MWYVVAVVLAEEASTRANTHVSSGIFGYINYLVDRDRKYIIDTLVKGTAAFDTSLRRSTSY